MKNMKGIIFMNQLQNNYYFSNFSHIYIEKEALKYSMVKNVLNKLQNSKIIIIDDYKNIFCRSNQNINNQKTSKKLIFAIKKDSYFYKNPEICHNFGFKNSYYTSCVLNCIYDCNYCFLQGKYQSSNIVVFVNILDYFNEIENLLKSGPIHLSISYDSDLLAFENLLQICQSWIKFSKVHPDLTIEIRTKSSGFKQLEFLKPSNNIILAWSLSPQYIISKYENNTPNLNLRIKSIISALNSNWNVRICFDPIINISDFKNIYNSFFEEIFSRIDENKITDFSIGFFRISKFYMKEMKKSNIKSDLIYYPYELLNNIYVYKDEFELLRQIKELLLKYVPNNKIYTLGTSKT